MNNMGSENNSCTRARTAIKSSISNGTEAAIHFEPATFSLMLSSCDTCQLGADVVHTGDVQPARDSRTRPCPEGSHMTSRGGSIHATLPIPAIDFGACAQTGVSRTNA